MIYNINKQIDELLEQEIVNPITGEVTYSPEGLATLKMQLDEQVTHFIVSMKNEEARLEAIAREEARLRELEEKTRKKIENAKTCLTMILGAGNKWSLGVYKVGWRKSSSVAVDDEELVPREFVKTKVVHSVDKLKVKGELEAGIKIPGCHLETKNNIQVN